jgi:hypothetical protein
MITPPPKPLVLIITSIMASESVGVPSAENWSAATSGGSSPVGNVPVNALPSVPLPPRGRTR